MAIVKSCSVDLQQFSSATVTFVSPSGFACVPGAVSHSFVVRLAVLFLTLKLWRTCFVFLSALPWARSLVPFRGAHCSAVYRKWVNCVLPVNLSVRRLQFKVVYIASVTVRIASKCTTETQSLIPDEQPGEQVENLKWNQATRSGDPLLMAEWRKKEEKQEEWQKEDRQSVQWTADTVILAFG